MPYLGITETNHEGSRRHVSQGSTTGGCHRDEKQERLNVAGIYHSKVSRKMIVTWMFHKRWHIGVPRKSEVCHRGRSWEGIPKASPRYHTVMRGVSQWWIRERDSHKKSASNNRNACVCVLVWFRYFPRPTMFSNAHDCIKVANVCCKWLGMTNHTRKH
jgi:hypothetical protein